MNTPNFSHPMHILIAIDGSAHSRAAVDLLCDLPLAAGSQVTALAVMLPRDASDFSALRIPLEQTEAILKDKGLEVKADIIAGYPAEVLVDFTDQHKPDLVVLGAKGLRATLGILLGGVAQQVVEYARAPVLVVRAPYTGLRRVLLVTDGSECSLRAEKYLQQFAFPPQAELRVMHVLPPTSLLRPDLVIRSWPVGTEAVQTYPSTEVEEALEQRSKEEERLGQVLLSDSLERLRTAGKPASRVMTRGDAASEIIEYAKTQSIDLIVTGSRGLSQVKSWLLGSVSRKIVHYASCSVLVVRGLPGGVC